MSGHIPIGANVDQVLADLGLGGRTILIEDTDANESTTFGPFDTRGVAAITLWTELLGWDTTESVNVLAYTRQDGKPWMPVTAVEISGGLPILSFTTIWPNNDLSGNGGIIPTVWTDVFVGLADFTVFVVQPNDGSGPSGVAASATSGDANLTFSLVGDVRGDYGNSFAVELVDPDAADQLLAITSTDGYTTTISLETDGAGEIVTVGGDLETLLAGVAGNVAGNWAVTVAASDTGITVVPELLTLSSGASGVTSVSYRVTGSY